MLKTYLLLSLRGLLKRKTISLINIAGLSLGLAASLTIFLYARYNLTYDQFHANSENIYLAYKERVTPTGVQPTYDTWVPLLGRMMSDLPEIENGVRIDATNITVEVDNQRFEEDGYFVDPSYFEVFDFPLAEGDQARPFASKNSVVLSQGMASKFFGKANPIGQEIRVNFNQIYVVSGVLAEYPSNGSIGEEILLPIESAPDYPDFQNEWGSSFLLTYVTLSPGHDLSAIEAKFPALIRSIWDQETANRTRFKLLPLHQSYDTFIGDTRDSYVLLLIALGILLIASINFMNLSTARSLERAREIGMRKVLGAAKSQLVFQFLSEAIMLSFISLALALLLVKLGLPFINAHFDVQLTLALFGNGWMLPGCLLLAILLGLFAGSYPAFFLSNFGILKSLSGSRSGGLKGAKTRNAMVVLQFFIAVLLIIGSLTIARQLNFMKQADLFFNKENLMVVPVSLRDFEDEDAARMKLATFRTELERHGSVLSLSTSRHVPGRWSGSNLFARPEGWEGDPLRMRFTYLDAHFLDTYQIDLLAGNGFLPDSEGDQRELVVINQAAMKAFGWQHIEGKSVMIGSRKIRVVGLIRDFNFETLREEIDPILHFHRVPSNATHRYLTMRVNPVKLSETVAFVQSKWDILDPDRDFTYFFVDEDMDQMYANEDQLLTLINLFTVLSIFIACLGLFGLISYLLDKKKREIGIRKVLGASASNITFLISKDFTRLVALAFGLAAPVAYMTMSSWLREFAYHIDQDWVIFFFSFLVALGLSWLTVFFKSFKAAYANPIDAIREE